MALQDILEKITKDARQTVKEIEREANREVDQVKKRIGDRVAKLQENEAKQTERLAQAEYRSRVVVYRKKIKYRLDEQKRTLLDDVFDTALTSLEGLTGQDRQNFFEKYIRQLRLTEGEYKVRGNENDVTMAVKILENHARNCSFHKEVEEDACGGCRIETDTVSYDLRFSTLLSEKRSALEAETAQQLFGQEKE